MNDYIKRVDALWEVERQIGPRQSQEQNDMLSHIRYNLLKVPTADVAPVAVNKWVKLSSMGMEFMCPACGREYEWRKPWKEHFCPNCGTKKNGVDE